MTHLFKLMVYEMHSYCTPLAPHVADVVRYIVKYFLGEEYLFGSDRVLKRTSGTDLNLRDFLRDRSFFRRESELNESYQSDRADKYWYQE